MFTLILVDGSGLQGESLNPASLTFTDLDGKIVDLREMRGQVILFDFWATTCVPCPPRVPELVALYAKYHDAGFEIVSISYDTNLRLLKDFVHDHNMTWPQFCDGHGFNNAVSEKLGGVHPIPSMWLMDKQGVIVTKEAYAQLEERVETLLKKSDSPSSIPAGPQGSGPE